MRHEKAPAASISTLFILNTVVETTKYWHFASFFLHSVWDHPKIHFVFRSVCKHRTNNNFFLWIPKLRPRTQHVAWHLARSLLESTTHSGIRNGLPKASSWRADDAQNVVIDTRVSVLLAEIVETLATETRHRRGGYLCFSWYSTAAFNPKAVGPST